MDFLDPKKQRQHIIFLFIGYALVAIAIVFATLVLYYRAYGFGLDKNGDVIQNGLLFVSSVPKGADIVLDGKDTQKNTDSRLSLVAGSYTMQLKRDGYRTWQQALDVEGGGVSRFDYPLLIPTQLETTPAAAYTGRPGMITQSPDQRWLIVQKPADNRTFELYDLKNPKQAPVTLTLPEAVVSSGTTESYQLEEWSNDNRHLVLTHLYDDKTEYIMLDRSDPSKSVNLSTLLGKTPAKLSLIDKKYDRYYLYDSTDQTLQSASLDRPQPVTVLEHVLAFKGYGSDVVLYVSSLSEASGKVTVDLLQDGKTYTLRTVSANTSYLLDITKYDGSWYMLIGADSEGRAYVLKNPVSQLSSQFGVIVPKYVLHVSGMNYAAFSSNTRFIMVENDDQFAVYDAEYDKGYGYTAQATLDTPQTHASWLDGNHLTYVSGGKLVLFDFDHGNPQTLQAADPAYLPVFSQDYSFVDTLRADGSGMSLDTTYLRTTADR